MNKLIKLIESSGLNESKGNVLKQQFSDFFQIADEWEKKINSIVIDSAEQVSEMKMMDEARKFLKGKRGDIERTRKELKEASLNEGRAIDTIAKELKGIIEPLELLAGEKARFAEIQEENRLNALKEERVKTLENLGLIEFLSNGLDLKNCTEEMFQMFIDATIQRKKQAEEQAERERLEAIEREKEAEILREENERLRKQAAERERLIHIEAEKQAQERAKLEAEQRAAIEAERQERAKIEAQLKAQQLKEQQEKEAIEAQKRNAALAPDKTKIIQLANDLNAVQIPEVGNEQLKEILIQVKDRINKLSNYLISLNESI